MSIHPLGEETPLDLKHAYLAGRLEQLQELSQIDPVNLSAYIEQQLAEIKAKTDAVVKMREIEGGRSTPRFFWESVSAGRVWLDDPKMVIIGEFKVAPYWQLDIEKKKKSIILPPSYPVFVGKSSDSPSDAPPEQGYIAHLYKLIGQEITKGKKSLNCLWDINWKNDKSGEKGIINRQLYKFGGTFYLDYKDIGSDRIWTVRWNRRHRELIRSDDKFLIDVAKRIEAIALGELTIQQAWDWLDSTELSHACEGTYQGRTISLSPYFENNTYCWRLTYKRNPRRVPRHKVGVLTDAIQNGRFDKILEQLEH